MLFYFFSLKIYFQENIKHIHLSVSSCLLFAAWQTTKIITMSEEKENGSRHSSVCLTDSFFFLLESKYKYISYWHIHIFPFVACRSFYGMKPTFIHSNVNAGNALNNFPWEEKKCVCVYTNLSLKHTYICIYSEWLRTAKEIIILILALGILYIF